VVHQKTKSDIANNLQLRDVAMATIFWLSTGYNFGCMIAIDTLSDSRSGFWGQLSDSQDRVSKGRCHGNLFGDAIWYNWLCVNDSDQAIAYGGGFEWSDDRMHILPIPAPMGSCHGNHFLPFYTWGAHSRHLTNMTEPSMCGGDVALCQITLTTCCY